MDDVGNLPLGPVPEGELRVGDRERHQAATALGDHFATGRLDQQEFDDRVQAAYAARTRQDLERLFVDLPEPAPFRARLPGLPARVVADAPPVRRWRIPAFVPVLPLLAALLIALTVITRVPVFPLFFVWLWLGCGRRAWRGPRRYYGSRYPGTRAW